MEIVWVGLGGTVGAVARFLSYQAIGRLLVSDFPLATFFVNAMGSFLFGLFLPQIRNHQTFALFFAIGVLGSFTTFSTFSFESVQLLKDGKQELFLLNVVASVGLGLFCFAAGFWLSDKMKVL